MRAAAIKCPEQACEEENSFTRKVGQVSLIRKEFVTLTGNHSYAVVLNQLLYWTQRTKDFQLMLEEERKDSGKNPDSPKYGWIYKTADELIEETMLQVDRTTIRRYLNFLIKKEWIFERTNPQNKWDKTTQYRVNIKKIQKDLLALESNSGETSKFVEISSGPNTLADGDNARSKEQNSPSDVHNPRSKLHSAHSNVQNAHCNTETTTEITNKDYTHKTCVREEFSISEEMITLWEQHICQKLGPILSKAGNRRGALQLTEERKSQLESLFAFHFQNDIRLWEQFCLRVKASPFLMGEGARRWRVSLDWILVDGNLINLSFG